MEALDPQCELGVLAERSTPGTTVEDLGCGLQGPSSRALRRALDPLRKRIGKLGSAASLAQAAELVAWAEEQPAYAALCTDRRIKGRRELRPDVLFGDPGEFVPKFLHVRRVAQSFDYEVPDRGSPEAWATLHTLVTSMQAGAPEGSLDALARGGGHGALLALLRSRGWLARRTEEPLGAEAHGPGVWFVGHNSVLVASDTTRLVVDPWFRPWRDGDPEGYRPLRAADLGRIDAVAITHSHGDHFHLGSLLSFPRDTLILVPKVDRESILSSDLARRLADVGFTRVRRVAWWERLRIGDLDVEALPFFGEQATAIDLVYEDLRNVGNTWIVRTPDVSAAMLADTGRDVLGSMGSAALEARRRWGAVDLVFGTMRGFSLFPLFLPFTTLDAMFVNAPVELLAVRQSLMHDASELLAVAEVFGAKHAVPYADGGAPWYFREGMGPAYAGYPSYAGESEAPEADREDPVSAPFPERLVEVAETRYGGADGPVSPLILRPGDLVQWSRGRPAIGRIEGFAWPWDDDADDDRETPPKPRQAKSERQPRSAAKTGKGGGRATPSGGTKRSRR